MLRRRRRGSVNRFYVTLLGALGLLVVLGVILRNLGQPPSTGELDAPLLLYCAAGLRLPVEQVVADYKREYGVDVQLQFDGSNTLLSKIELAKTGDLFLAADDSYTAAARKQGLVDETLPLAVMRPVLAVRQGNPKQLRTIGDLLHDGVKIALANPDQTAIGKLTRRALRAAGKWDAVNDRVTRTGVFKPTVTEVANDLKLGSVDAAVVWDTTAAQYPEFEVMHLAEFASHSSQVEIGVLTSTKAPTAALRLARYLTARDRGLPVFEKHGFVPVDGDKWAQTPEITFYCGSVNRRAVEDVTKTFSEREGVFVNTIYNGCGILTAQMQTIRAQHQEQGFPDTYMACDRYYLENVKDWFQDDVDVSDTDVVIVVPKGNPGGVRTLRDLAKPGIRISVGQPEQCTIGVLARNMLQAEGIYAEVMQNVMTQTANSAMLIPTVTTGSVDATLAYATDTRAVADEVDVIRVESPAAKAIQPFAIARSSDHKYLGRRLYRAIARSRAAFEQAGFHFRVADADEAADSK
jgi:molybdenum ABC transporter molybdate-binding protein